MADKKNLRFALIWLTIGAGVVALLGFFVPWASFYGSLKFIAVEYDEWGVMFLVFLHATVILLPTSMPVIFFCTLNPERALVYGMAAIVGAMAGYIASYALGYFGGKPVLRRFGRQDQVDDIHRRLKKYELWTVLFAGFMPIPYFFFSIACGVFRITFYRFVLGCLFSRSVKTGVTVSLFYYYRDEVNWVRDLIETHLPGYLMVLGGIPALIIAVLIYRRYKKTQRNNKNNGLTVGSA